ncbi:putative retrotransposon protein [Tanacetum coccineum]
MGECYKSRNSTIKDNEVWDLVELHPDGKTVDSKWLVKKKSGMDGAIHTYKARLVANGYTQTPGIDYEKTFSPVADIRAIRILIAIAAFYDYEIWKMDVKTAFLNRYLSKEVYMEQPEASGSNVTFLILYVDDILIKGNNIPMLQDVKSYLGSDITWRIPNVKLRLSKSQGATTPTELKRMSKCSIYLGCDLQWTTVKNILKYLRKTKDMFLVYGGDIK